MDFPMPDGPAILRPNRDNMLAHISALFGEAMKGQVEICWTEADTRSIKQAKLFPLDDLDAIADFAYQTNAKAGHNVYIGMATRHPNTSPFGRTNDSDYFETHAVAVDFDEPGAVQAAKAIYDGLNIRPTYAVVTGEHPHRRAQLWWKLDAPFQNAAVHSKIQRGLALLFGGDISISNPGRVMRLAGSIAWPKKEGRKTEVTVFYPAGNGEYPTSRLLALAEDGAAKASTSDKPHGLGLDTGHVGADIAALIADAAIPGKWHESVLRLTASLVGKGLPDEAILAMAGALTQPGFTEAQTMADMEVMIRGARQRGFTPDDPQDTAQEGKQQEQAKQAEGFDIFAWDIAVRFAGEPPPLEWVIEGVLEKQSLGVVAGMGGIGKSFLGLDACISVANRPLIGGATAFGNPIHEHGNAIFFTGEDNAANVHRRIKALDATGAARAREGRVFVVPLPDQRGLAPIVSDGGKGLQIAAAYSSIVAQIKRVSDLRLIVLDPMQIFIHADLNDPAVTQAWWLLMAELASDTGASIICAHHMNKASLQAKTLEEAREGIKGNTGVVDGARMAYALWKAPKGENDKIAMGMGFDPEETEIVLGGIVKANGPADRRVHYFHRNENGILEDISGRVQDVKANPGKITEALARAIAKEIEHAWREGKPWSLNPQAKRSLRYLPDHARVTWNLEKKATEELMQEWQSNGIVTVAVRDTDTKIQGLKMLQMPW